MPPAHVLLSYMTYYNDARTRLSLHPDAPVPRAVETAGRSKQHLGGPLRNSSVRCDSFATRGRLEPQSEPSAHRVCPQNATALYSGKPLSCSNVRSGCASKRRSVQVTAQKKPAPTA